jgi:RNA polymerase sigma factor for flagellar operon FliA
MRPAHDEEVAKELGVDLNGFYKLLDDSRGISIFNEYDMKIQNGNGDGESAEEDTFELGFDQSPLQTLKKAELVKVIAGAIDRLPKNEKTAVSLYYYEELTMKEIGEVMAIQNPVYPSSIQRL